MYYFCVSKQRYGCLVLGIFNMGTDINACDCARRLCRHCKRVWTKKLNLGERSLAAPGNRTCLSSMAVWSLTNWATSPPFCITAVVHRGFLCRLLTEDFCLLSWHFPNHMGNRVCSDLAQWHSILRYNSFVLPLMVLLQVWAVWWKLEDCHRAGREGGSWQCAMI